MNKVALLNFFAICLYASVQAQTTINAASSNVTIEGNNYSYSIGEMSIISTVQTPSLIITQGYHQPNMSAVATIDGANSALFALQQLFQVYPNPTSNLLNIASEQALQKLFITINDASGCIVYSKNEENTELGKNFTVDMKSFAAGNYFLQLNSITKDQQQNTLTYKIQKLVK